MFSCGRIYSSTHTHIYTQTSHARHYRRKKISLSSDCIDFPLPHPLNPAHTLPFTILLRPTPSHKSAQEGRQQSKQHPPHNYTRTTHNHHAQCEATSLLLTLTLTGHASRDSSSLASKRDDPLLASLPLFLSLTHSRTHNLSFLSFAHTSCYVSRAPLRCLASWQARLLLLLLMVLAAAGVCRRGATRRDRRTDHKTWKRREQ